jgi:hypothetical protein
MRFSHAELEQFAIDPRGAHWGPCPWCGGSIVVGRRKDTGNTALCHEMLPDPARPGESFCGCERFRELAATNQVELLRLLRAARFRLQPLV